MASASALAHATCLCAAPTVKNELRRVAQAAPISVTIEVARPAPRAAPTPAAPIRARRARVPMARRVAARDVAVDAPTEEPPVEPQEDEGDAEEEEEESVVLQDPFGTIRFAPSALRPAPLQRTRSVSLPPSSELGDRSARPPRGDETRWSMQEYVQHIHGAIHREFADGYLTQLAPDAPGAVDGARRITFLLIVLARDGALVSTTVYRSSGDPEFDQAALLSVERAAPFPAPPPSLWSDGTHTRMQWRFGGVYDGVCEPNGVGPVLGD